MVYELACLLHNEDCKNIIRTTKQPDSRITFFRNIRDFIQEIQKHDYDLLLIEESEISDHFSQCISGKTQSLSTIIITPQFSKYYFQKYVKLGFRYIIDKETFIYLIPTILENLEEFLSTHNYPDTEITLKGMTVATSRGYLILHDCKIITSRFALTLLTILLRSSGYCSLSFLQSELEKKLHKKIGESYVTVTISRLNHDIHKVTGLKIIRNRYGFGYYIDL